MKIFLRILGGICILFAIVEVIGAIGTISLLIKSGLNNKPAKTSYMKCPKCGGFSPKGFHHYDNCGADL